MPYKPEEKLFGDSHFWKFYSKDPGGDQSDANIEMLGDFSVTSQEFEFKPPPGKIAIVCRILVSIRDNGNFAAAQYGNNLTLANGLNLFRKLADGSKVTMTPRPIKTNAEWGTYCFNVNHSAYGVGDQYLTARWTFLNQGAPLWLRSSTSETVGVELSDDFSDLVSHLIHAQGRLINE